MTSPVPEDVMEAAGEACSQIAEYGKPAQETVARTILAERERCARIADAHSECERDCGDVIAAAIRGNSNG